MNYFYEHFFKPQQVIPQNRVFSPEHIIITSILVCLIIGSMMIQKQKRSKKFSQQVMMILGLIMLFLEIFRIAWKAYYYGFSIRTFRFDWCNQVCMVLPFVAIFKIEKIYPYIDTLAFMGGVGVLAYPMWVFYDYAGIHIMAVQSMISHGLMILIALTMPLASKEYRRKSKRITKPLIGLGILLVVAYVASNRLGVSYLLMKDAGDLPIISLIPYPYYWILLLPLMVLGIYIARKLLVLIDKWSMQTE